MNLKLLRKYLDQRPEKSPPFAGAGINNDRLKELLEGAEPTLRELRLLSATTGLSLRELAADEQTSATYQFLYRNTEAKRREEDPLMVLKLSQKIDASLKLLHSSRTSFSWSDEFQQSNTYADAETNAARFRSMFFGDDQVSPLLSLPDLVIRQLHVLLFVVQAKNIDGASVVSGGCPFIFVSPRYPARMLFTLAHELGHLLSHHRREEDLAVFDFFDEGKPLQPRRKAESYAHTFASCLLLPPKGLGVALKKMRERSGVENDLGDVEILTLSRFYGVSFHVAAKRCEDLDLLPRGGAASLNEWVKRNYGSAEKRAEAIGLPARNIPVFPPLPEFLLASAIKGVREGRISIGRAASTLGLSIFDLTTANQERVH